MSNIAFSARHQRAGGGRWGAATPWLKSSIPGLYSAPIRLVSGRHAQTHHHAQHDDVSKIALHSDIHGTLPNGTTARPENAFADGAKLGARPYGSDGCAPTLAPPTRCDDQWGSLAVSRANVAISSKLRDLFSTHSTGPRVPREPGGRGLSDGVSGSVTTRQLSQRRQLTLTTTITPRPARRSHAT